MKQETKILLEEYKSEFKSYKSFLDKNDWINDVNTNNKGNLESGKLNTELSVVKTILSSMIKFKEDAGEDLHLKVVKDFINSTVIIIKKHVSKIDLYRKLHPLNDDAGEEAFKFQSKLFSDKTSTKVALSKLNIDESELSRKSLDLFYGNTKAPLMMREFLCETFPDIKTKIDALPIDFTTGIINPATSNEMFINLKAKDIPPWDPNKHFFEQPISTIQFWEEERKKITNGVNINGYYISDWLYWHLNHFKLSFGVGKDKKTTQPNFRDNEYFLDQMYRKAEKIGDVGLLLFGTRRWSKSVTLSSKIYHKLTVMPKANGTIQGFSEKPDLEAIINYISDAVENIHPALKIPANNMDLKEGAILGLKGKKQQDRYDYSRLSVINLQAGTTKIGSQKTAGATPDIFVFDEVAKGAMLAPWNAAIPSFSGDDGKFRLVPLLAATSGDSELSQDAERVLKDPATYSILPMDWDMLEEFVDPEFITWDRSTFGFFLPAQQSLRAPKKIITNFQDFLKIENEGLANIKMYNTDWEKGKQYFEEERKKLSKDIDSLASFTNAFPLTVEDCYMSSEVNKFPGLQAKRRRAFVEENGLQGQRVWLFKNGDRVEAQQTKDPIITDYPYKGGNFEAPIVILDDPYGKDGEKPPLGLYCFGFDDVKQSISSGDSVMSCTVFKRSYEGGEWANRIVAYYDSRPNNKKDYYKNLYLLLKYYNGRMLHENEDNGFIEYMEDNHMEEIHVHLSDGVGLATEENLNRNKNRKYGWSPTGLNIYRLEETMVIYTKEEKVVIGDNEDLTGIDRINHPLLLEEIYKYKKDRNADRLRSFGLALKLAKYYDNTNQYMKSRKKRFNEEEMSFKKKKKTIGVKGFTFTNKLKKY